MCDCNCAKYKGERILKIETHPPGFFFDARQTMVTQTESGEIRTYARHATSNTTWSDWERWGS
jgi:hypothetical protein